MNTKTLSRAALVSAIALAFSVPTLAQTGAGGGGQTKAGATATTGTTSGTVSGAATMGAGATATTPGAATPSGAGMPPTSTSRGTADNTNSKSGPGVADSWADKYASENNGRISRQAYMDEMGRRFDRMDSTKRGSMTREQYVQDLGTKWGAMDTGNQGLTPAEVSRITGKVDVNAAAVPLTGSGAQAGNMGPSNTKK